MTDPSAPKPEPLHHPAQYTAQGCKHEKYTEKVGDGIVYRFCDDCSFYSVEGEFWDWRGGARPRASNRPKRDPMKKTALKPGDFSDLDAVTRVGAEFRAYITLCGGPSPFALSIVKLCNPESARLAEVCADLNDKQRTLALALCEALSK